MEYLEVAHLYLVGRVKFLHLMVLHKFVVYDMAVQSLQRDYKVIENLKTSKVYLPILDKLLDDISQECYNAKRVLAKDKIKLVRWEKTDEYFSDLVVATAGEDQVFTYANQALKTQVEKLLLSHIIK
ncbi:aconitate hydratase [Lysinibacillus sphaericus]|uniref:aconitate hydratase n=1 Tax=Lysinibacillus sphaericus TaxID=1421 RepID=UPI002E32D88C|nr:aconitate hydratase [Lysinibacillus sphaericus]